MLSNRDLKKLKIGVYQLVPVNKDTAKFVEKGYVKYGKNFDDEYLNLSFLKDKTTFKVDNNRVKYNDIVYFQFFKDNLASTYISNTTKVPVFHCSIMYQKKIVLGNLMNIYLYFNVEEAKKIKSFDHLINTNLKGKYELVVEYNDRKENLPFDEFVSYEDLTLDILQLLSTELMSEIIDSEMDKKDEDRRKQYGAIEDYDIPEKVVNFNELVKKYEETGNINDVEEMYSK